MNRISKQLIVESKCICIVRSMNACMHACMHLCMYVFMNTKIFLTRGRLVEVAWFLPPQ
jgi:hypothetical protein